MENQERVVIEDVVHELTRGEASLLTHFESEDDDEKISLSALRGPIRAVRRCRERLAGVLEQADRLRTKRIRIVHWFGLFFGALVTAVFAGIYNMFDPQTWLRQVVLLVLLYVMWFLVLAAIVWVLERYVGEPL
jgi:hypothetical protein